MCVHRVRFYLACAVLAALVFVWPEMALACWPVVFFLPGCACCPGCTIFSDDFSTDRTGTDYTVVSGSWSVSGGVLTTSSASAVIVENTAGTTGHGRVAVEAKVSASNTSFRIIGSYSASTDYLFAEVTINGASSTLKLWSRISSVETQIGDTLTFVGSTGTYYTIDLCWNGALAVSTLEETFGAVVIGSRSGPNTTTNNKAGLGAVLSSGTATFENFSFSKHAEDDTSCTACSCELTCSYCTPTNVPCEWQVDISGITNGTCGECTALNGTFVVNLRQSVACWWDGLYDTVDTANCGTYTNLPSFNIGSGGLGLKQFFVYTFSSGEAARSSTESTSTACTGRTLSLSYSGINQTPNCDVSGISATVSPL